jgi:rubrerythrin
MAFKKGKQKFSKEEIIDILKRNVSLFKDEDEFVQYIVDLATYLVEHRLQTATGSDANTPEREGQPSIIRRTEPYRTRERDEELLEVLKKHATQPPAHATCRMCGAPCEGQSICPSCGNMTF